MVINTEAKPIDYEYQYYKYYCGCVYPKAKKYNICPTHKRSIWLIARSSDKIIVPFVIVYFPLTTDGYLSLWTDHGAIYRCTRDSYGFVDKIENKPISQVKSVRLKENYLFREKIGQQNNNTDSMFYEEMYKLLGCLDSAIAFCNSPGNSIIIDNIRYIRNFIVDKL